MVGRSLWGPVDGGKVNAGICYRTEVLLVAGAAPCFAMDIQVRPELVISGLGDEVYAISELVDRMSLLRDF